MSRRLAAIWLGLLIAPVAMAADYVAIPPGPFVSALATDGSASHIAIRSFAMRTEPVTQAEYLAFVRKHPTWQRDQVAPLLAGPRYLASWRGPLTPGAGVLPQQPVTEISWFAARAFCASEQARLPSWYEWEYVAAADASRRDARQDPARNQALLTAIQTADGDRPGLVGQHRPDIYGVYDLNRLLWEWTDDYAAMFPHADPRDPGDAPTLALCGGSALAFADKSQYALILRVAALTALGPADSAPRVGFRCVRDLQGE